MENYKTKSDFILKEVSKRNGFTIDLIYEYVDDLFERRLSLAVDNNDKQKVFDDKESIQNLNGTIVLPVFIIDKPYALISNKQINEYCDYIKTLTHEVTHIYDYYNYANFYGIKELNNIYNMPDYDLIYLWSEFNAYKNGITAYKKWLNPQHPRDVIARHIIKEIIDNTNELNAHLENQNCYFLKYMYYIVKYIARFASYEILFPKQYKMPITKINYRQDQILGLYEYLLSHANFNLFITDKSALENILSYFKF